MTKKEMVTYLQNLESELFDDMLSMEDNLGNDSICYKRAESRWGVIYGALKEMGIKPNLEGRK